MPYSGVTHLPHPPERCGKEEHRYCSRMHTPHVVRPHCACLGGLPSTAAARQAWQACAATRTHATKSASDACTTTACLRCLSSPGRRKKTASCRDFDHETRLLAGFQAVPSPPSPPTRRPLLLCILCIRYTSMHSSTVLKLVQQEPLY